MSRQVSCYSSLFSLSNHVLFRTTVASVPRCIHTTSLNKYGISGISNILHNDFIIDPIEVILPSSSSSNNNNSIEQVATSSYHTLFLTTNGDVYSCGKKGSYLGLGIEYNQISPSITQILASYAPRLFGSQRVAPVAIQQTPIKIQGLPPIKQIAVGKEHSIALTKDGKIYTWGNGGNNLTFTQGPLGHGNRKTSFIPKLVKFPQSHDDRKMIAIACGDTHSLSLSEDGLVYSWGSAEYGVLGSSKLLLSSRNNGSSPSQVVFPITTNDPIIRIVASRQQSGVLTKTGKCFVWGRNDFLQLGTPSGFSLDLNAMERYPVPVSFNQSNQNNNIEQQERGGEYNNKNNNSEKDNPSSHIVELDMGPRSTIWLNDKGQAYVAGERTWTEPSLILSEVPFQLVAAGRSYFAGVDLDSRLWTWNVKHGSNLSQQQPLGYTCKKGEFIELPRLVTSFSEKQEQKKIGKIHSIAAADSHMALLVEAV